MLTDRNPKPLGISLVALLAAMFALGFWGACDRAAPSENPIVDSVTEDGFVTLTQASRVMPPREPPPIWVVDESGMRPIRSDASYADWRDVSPGVVVGDPLASDWPSPVPRDGRTHIRIEAEARPTWVVAYLFHEIDPETGWPVGTPAHADTSLPYAMKFECEGWFGEHACPPVVDGSWTFDVFGDSYARREYMTVNVTWSPPWREVDGRWMAGEVRASYSLHFAND